LLSLAVATHVPVALQYVVEEGHRQVPPAQTSMLAQAWPHVPQFLLSAFVSTHAFVAEQ
jgi:hypothetical protein